MDQVQKLWGFWIKLKRDQAEKLGGKQVVATFVKKNEFGKRITLSFVARGLG